MKNNRKKDSFSSGFKDDSEKFFEDEEDESWKEKVVEKAEEVASNLEEEIQRKKTQTEKNLEAFHEHRRKKKEKKSESFQDFDTGLTETPADRDFSLDEDSEDDWQEKIDAPTFIVLSVEIILLTYFFLAVLGYVPFF